MPVPKKYLPASPNYVHLVALMSHVMKSFDPCKLHIGLGPGRGVDDAVATLLNYVLCHLEDAKTHARVLYMDISSAFNTLQPHLLSLTCCLRNVFVESGLAL